MTKAVANLPGWAILIAVLLTSQVQVWSEDITKGSDQRSSWTEANHVVKRVPQSTQKAELISQFKKAENHRAILETERAISEYSSCLKLDPHFEKARFGRAMCYLDSENYRQAVIDFEQVDKDSQMYAQALQMAGLCHYHLKEFAEAKLDYDHLFQIKEYAFDKPNYHWQNLYDTGGPLAYRAQCYLMLNMPDLAVKDSSDALKLPNKRSLQRVLAFRTRARAYVMLKKADAAINDYQAAVEIVKNRKDAGFFDTIGGPPTSTALLRERAKLYDDLGKPELAQKDRDAARNYAGKLYGDAPFRIHN